jgi:hypothetical protein
MQLYFSITNTFQEEEKTLFTSSIQERPLSFLGGNGGDGELPDIETQ